MHGQLIPVGPQCPKCKSYMYMPRIKDKVYFRLCKTCGFKGLKKNKFNWDAFKIYMERWKFWKS